MNRTLPELIEQLTTRAACPSDITDALTEIDRRLTALEERTAPPLSGNEVTANLLRAAEDARAKAVEDGLAMLEGRVQGAESEPTERDVGYGVVSAVGWPDDRAKLRARVDAASAEFMAHVGQGPPPTARAMFERAPALVLDGDTDNGAGKWDLQEECVREGWATLLEEVRKTEREAARAAFRAWLSGAHEGIDDGPFAIDVDVALAAFERQFTRGGSST